jgi:hypothetical protein
MGTVTVRELKGLTPRGLLPFIDIHKDISVSPGHK